MKTPALAACLHDHVKILQWDHGVDPDTGYHDAGITVHCHDCGEEFTDSEFWREMSTIADELEALRTGTLLEAPLGLTLEVLDVRDGEMIYRCRDGAKIASQLQRAALPVVIGQIRHRILAIQKQPEGL